MKRSKTHTGNSFSSTRVRNGKSDSSIDRHVLARPHSKVTDHSNHLPPSVVSNEFTQVASCPSVIYKTTSTPIDIPHKGNAVWTIQDEVAEMKEEQMRYDHATYQMYHRIRSSRQRSRSTNDIQRQMPAFPHLPDHYRRPAIVEEELDVFKMDI